MSFNVDRIDEPMLNIDSTGVKSLEITDQLFVAWRCGEWILGQQLKQLPGRVGKPGAFQLLDILDSVLG